MEPTFSQANGRGRLYKGDCLEVLAELEPASIDLVLTDPPFGTMSNRRSRGKNDYQYKDTWNWTDECEDYLKHAEQHAPTIYHVIQMASFTSKRMAAYLVFIAKRLQAIARVMRPTASIYLQCDDKASHYLRVLMDTVFGASNYKNTIVWHYQKFHGGSSTAFARNHDDILFYAWPGAEFNRQRTQRKSTRPYTVHTGRLLIFDPANTPQDIIDRLEALTGRPAKFVTEPGPAVDDVWTWRYQNELNSLSSGTKERTGYPTQKPLTLVRRMISVSSSKDSVVLDPFAGSGTTLRAAQMLGRQWIGIDSNTQAIDVCHQRLTKPWQQPLLDEWMLGE